jgi:hypothetical protein
MLSFGVALSTACGGDSAPDADTAAGTGTGGTDTDTDGSPGPQHVENNCEVAPSGDVGLWLGTLRQASSGLGGACGEGGPDAFLRLSPPVRVDVRVQARGVGFVPRVGVMFGGCEERWEDLGVLCTEALEGWIYDVPGGTPLVISVGIDPDDPALETPADLTPDPLDFALDVQMREVLVEGEYCGYDGAGRCAGGTACVKADADALGICVALPADTCAVPQDFAIDAGSGELQVDPAVLQSDAHAHSCAGGRERERVFRLGLPQGLPDGTDLEIRTDHPDVALALRAPGCDVGAEVACAPATSAGAVVTLTDVPDLAGPGIAPYLFVELPDSMGPGDPPVVLNYILAGP